MSLDLSAFRRSCAKFLGVLRIYDFIDYKIKVLKMNMQKQ